METSVSATSSTVTCLAIGDPHFMVNNVEDARVLCKKVNALVVKFQPTFVVILGDILHTHERVHITPLGMATEFILRLAKKVAVFLLIGNHDLINHDQFLTNNHAFNAFKRVENVTVCDRPVVRVIKGHKFVFCPYVPPGRFVEALDTVKERGLTWENARCIFAHQEFYGCRFNPTTSSVDGDMWLEEYPLVVSGHIHNEQRLAENLYYTGSSMQHSFGETADKIVALLTFKKGLWRLKRIDLEMRKKRIVYLDIERVNEFKPPENTQCKLVLKGTPEQFKSFRGGKKYRELVKEGVLITLNPLERVQEQSAETEKRQTVAEILHELVNKEDKYVQEAYKKLVE